MWRAIADGDAALAIGFPAFIDDSLARVSLINE